MEDQSEVFALPGGKFRATECPWMCKEEKHQLLDVLPGAIAKNIRAILANGKLPDNWHERAANFSDVLCERADVALYPDTKSLKEAQNIASEMAWVIALCSFIPCGVEIFGVRYEAWFGS